MNTPVYNSFVEKDAEFIDIENSKIETREELDSFISRYIGNNNYLYRGINTATYKLYSSSQVQWMLTDAITKNPDTNAYNCFIKKSIELVRNNDYVQKYINSISNSNNDIFILALMQHFGMPSPMLDFSHSVLFSLYFACDKCNMTLTPSQDQLSDYVSLYVINRNIDWVKYSIQDIMMDSANKLNKMLEDSNHFAAGVVDTKNVEREFITLPYEKFKDFSFVPVNDNPTTSITIKIPILDFSCEYQIINDRIISQQGMFIANNKVDRPLVELMNNCCDKKYFNGSNIHKRLLDYLKAEHLDKRGINTQSVYVRDDQTIQNLEKEFELLKCKVLSMLKKM